MVLRLVAIACVVAAEASSDPNILFVLTDDMGWGDVGFNTEYHQPGPAGEKWTVNPPRTPKLDEVALGNGTMLFQRFYSGSPVCSPTRASIMTGRTPTRSCINGAEGCGSKPAWSCYGTFPLPPTEYTVAEALQSKGYATTFLGKWHLGDFWVKDGRPSSYAMDKWPSSHPGMHGYDEWHATEASASSSTPNCGCDSSWAQEGQGCITGGGVWKKKAGGCTNYWSQTKSKDSCRASGTTSRDCLSNLTSKIEGDDSMYMMSVFEDFLSRQSGKWYAHLSIHTNHEPHPAMPEWFNAYKDAEGNPAGDYLGTISQMDAAFGHMIDVLTSTGHYDNTMIWFAADNGPHSKGGRPSGQLAATNGLRQCKASVFEGGIRVGGFVHWPKVISGHVDTKHAAVTMDFLPTVLDLIGVTHPHQSWPSDGMSLLPLLRGDVSPTAPRSKGMGFKLNSQVAWQEDFGGDGVWKILKKPNQGQCDVFAEPYASMSGKELRGPFLFNLSEDPTESNNLCSSYQTRCDAMAASMEDFETSVDNSQVAESQCAAAPVAHERASLLSVSAFTLQTENGQCLAVEDLINHGVVTVDSCDVGVRWDDIDGHLVSAEATHSALCLKLDSPTGSPCSEGSTLWSGACDGSDPRFHIDANGHLVTDECPALCAVPSNSDAVSYYTSKALALGMCVDAITFSKTTSVQLV